MRRRRGGGPAPAEPCGVWLDTAELKRGLARPPSARLKAAGRMQSPALLPQPGRRQTTIPTFFSPRAGEGDKENARPARCSPAEGCGGSGLPLPAWPVKILPLPQLERAREQPPGAEQGVRGTARAWKTPLGALELQVQSERRNKTSRGAGGDSWCCSRSQSPEKSWIFPGEVISAGREAQPWSRAASGMGSAGAEHTKPGPGAEHTEPGPGAEHTGTEHTKPGPGAEHTKPGPGAQHTKPGPGAQDTNPGPGAQDTKPGPGAEHIKPGPGAQDTKPGPGAAPRAVCCSPQSPVRAQPLRERGQIPAGSCGQLFSQDSQGNRVIAHRARASPPRASQPLFTQDSEGNRVIKHWE